MAPPHESAFAVDGPRPGDVVAGKYRLLRVIGNGGMGVVLAAEHLELRQPVALKFLHREMARRPEVVRRFLREGQAAARLRGEHTARVLDAARTAEGQPFLVMELLEGVDLGQKLRRDGPLPVAEAALYVIQTCAAIGEAHGLGIVHRDLKPANLFLARRPDGTPMVKVVDFGISKMTDLGDAPGEVTLTTGDDVLGSPLYMAPEQIRTPSGVDGRADLWSLGAILHRLVTNRHAFGAETPAAVLAAIIADPPIPLRVHAPRAPAELEAIVARCLTRDLGARWQTAAELADALRPFAPGAPPVHVAAAAAAAPVPLDGPTPLDVLPHGEAPREVVPHGAPPREVRPLDVDAPGAGGVGAAAPDAATRGTAALDAAALDAAEPTTIGGGSVSSIAAAQRGRRRLVSSVVLGTAIGLVAVGVAATMLVGNGEPPRSSASAPAGGATPATSLPGVAGPGAPDATRGGDAATATALEVVTPPPLRGGGSAAPVASVPAPPPTPPPALPRRPPALDPLDDRL